MSPFRIAGVVSSVILLLLLPAGPTHLGPAVGAGTSLGHASAPGGDGAFREAPAVISAPRGLVGPINGAYYNETNSTFGGTMQNPLLALNATSGTLFAADQDHGFVTAVNASTGTLLRSAVLARNPPSGGQVTGLSFLPTSNRLVVSYDWGASGSLLVLDGGSLGLVANLTPFPGYANYPPGRSVYVPSFNELWLQDLDHGAVEILRASDLGVVAILPTIPSCPNGCGALGLVAVAADGYVLSETASSNVTEVALSNHAVLRTIPAPNSSFVFGLTTFDAATDELWVQNFSAAPVRELGRFNATTGNWLGDAATQAVNFRGLAYDARLHAVLVADRNTARCATNELLWLNGSSGSLLTFACGPGFPLGSPTSYAQLLPWDTASSSTVLAASPAEAESFSLGSTPSPSIQRLAAFAEIAPTTVAFALPGTGELLTAGTGANGTALFVANASTGSAIWTLEVPQVGPVAIDPSLGYIYVANGTGPVASYRVADGTNSGSVVPAPSLSATGSAVDPVHHWLYLLSTRANGTVLFQYNLSANGGGAPPRNVTLGGVAACGWTADAVRAIFALTSCHLPSTPTGNNVTLLSGLTLAKLETVATGVYPISVISDAAGTLYVDAASSGSVTEVNATSLVPREISTPGFAATSLEVDASHGLLWGTVGANLSVRNLSSPLLPLVTVIPGPSLLEAVVSVGAGDLTVAVTSWTDQWVTLVPALTPKQLPPREMEPSHQPHPGESSRLLCPARELKHRTLERGQSHQLSYSPSRGTARREPLRCPCGGIEFGRSRTALGCGERNPRRSSLPPGLRDGERELLRR
ncbi:MAG: hypothetical protein L3K07_06410 [Thermoplasmata archaeon]|nr:hypothetical protein [Thermoplasmata archaeon]